MRNLQCRIMAAGFILTILISNIGSLVSDGISLDRLRGSVLRLHILANSDSEIDQKLKLMVRDELLRCGIFDSVETLSEAEEEAEEKLPELKRIAEAVLRENGCPYRVFAELADVDFDERIYGDITMPAGNYRALRIKIGRAEGHNWWCVMYPPLCLPAACETEKDEKQEETEESPAADITEDKKAEEKHFDEKELDILHKPKKYKLRFAIWDKLKSFLKE